MVRLSPFAVAVLVEFPYGARGGADLVHVDFLQGLSGLEARGFFASVVVECQSINNSQDKLLAGCTYRWSSPFTQSSTRPVRRERGATQSQ